MRQFAECISPWAACDDDLARLRERLADAERRERSATTWVARARVHQEVLTLRREIQSAETDRALEARRNAPRPANEHAALAVQAIAAGRALPPRASTCPAGKPGATKADPCTCGLHVWAEEPAAAMNARGRAPINFAALSAFVEQARQAGLLRPR